MNPVNIHDPVWLYALYVAGLYGLLLEATHPGALLPSVVGVVLIAVALLGLVGAGLSFTGPLLVTLGVVAFALSFVRQQFWLWYLGGVGLFLAGTAIYFTQPTVSLVGEWIGVVTGAVLGIVMLTGVALRALQRLYRDRTLTGTDRYLGQTARVTQELTPATTGKINVLGEIWPARLDSATSTPLPHDARVKVTGYGDDQGKTLLVRPLQPPDAPGPSTGV